jgi:hypothetical protein
MGQNDRLLAQCMNRSKRDGCTEDDTFMKDVDHITSTNKSALTAITCRERRDITQKGSGTHAN